MRKIFKKRKSEFKREPSPFAVVHSDFQTARNYWKVLKNRLNKEGSESVTKCNRLKLQALDGKFYLTDVADTEIMLRIIQSIPSPNAEPFKLWLARVGYERIEETIDPELGIPYFHLVIPASLFVIPASHLVIPAKAGIQK